MSKNNVYIYECKAGAGRCQWEIIAANAVLVMRLINIYAVISIYKIYKQIA